MKQQYCNILQHKKQHACIAIRIEYVLLMDHDLAYFYHETYRYCNGYIWVHVQVYSEYHVEYGTISHYNMVDTRVCTRVLEY